jgi:hypothetical protein
MGAYIYYRTADVEEADRAMALLMEIEENKLLLDKGWGVGVNSQEDIDWAKKEFPHMVDSMIRDQGRGEYKVSGWDAEEELGISFEAFLERLTVIFEKLNKDVEMKYLYGSCAFGGDYFSQSQIERITQEGELFSNK